MIVVEEGEVALAAEGGQEAVWAGVLEVVQAEGQAAAGEWGEEIARAPGRVETASALSVKQRHRTRGAHPVIR